MSDEENNLQERLRMMKAIQFYEIKQFNLKRQIFNYLLKIYKNKIDRYDKYYHMILYMKVFKAIMDYGIMNRQEEYQYKLNQRQKQKNNYQILDQQQFKDQRNQILVRILQQNKKKRIFSQLSKIMRQKQKNNRKKIIQRQITPKINTQVGFYPKIDSNSNYLLAKTSKIEEKRDDINLYSKQLFNLQNSRKSQLSANTSYNQQNKRKFAAIKTLPPKPPLQINQNNILEKKIEKLNSKQQVYQQNINKLQKIQSQINDKYSEIKNIPSRLQQVHISQKISTLNQQKSRQKQSVASRQLQIKNQKTSTSYIINKSDDIIARLSQIKMAEIQVIKQIIEDFQFQKIKDPLVNQKKYLKYSLNFLENYFIKK